MAGDDVVVGYDPISIARLGPVAGLALGVVAPDDKGARREEERLWVWTRTRNVVGEDGKPFVAREFQVGADAGQGRREDAEQGRAILCTEVAK